MPTRFTQALYLAAIFSALLISIATANDEENSPAPDLPPLEIIEVPEPRLVDVPLADGLRREAEPIPTAVMLNGGAGVLNPDFSRWAGGVPFHWFTDARRVNALAQVADKDTSNIFDVEMKGGYPYNYLRQIVDVRGAAAGKTVVFSMDVKIGGDGKGKLVFVDLYAGDKRTDSRDHPGDGEWVRLEVARTFPADFQGGPIDVGIVHYSDPKGSCFVRSPKIEIRD